MPKRGENIHKRKDGRWEGRYRVFNGTESHYRSVYGKSYREVKIKMQNCSAGVENSHISCQDGALFENILAQWIENNRIRQKQATISKYEYIIQSHISPDLGKIKVSEITASTVNSFLNDKINSGRLNGTGGLSPSYVQTMMLIIRSALKYASDEGLCMPLKSTIYKPVPIKHDLSILSHQEQYVLERFLLSGIDATRIGVYLSLHTGMRIGEVCGLSWEDVDFINGIIHVRHTAVRINNRDQSTHSATKLILDSPKTKASLRDIPISTPLMKVLKAGNEQSKSCFVISENANFVDPRTYDNRFHRLLHECGIRKINYHALRHTFATRCIEAGVDVKSLSEILGHSNVSITLNTYVHSSIEMKRQQLEKLSKIST